jgi:L-alanine-DL-glutamate epimerase-like enolase superfamily enzyme
MRTDLGGTSVEIIENGFARIPTGDGLGITVNEEALEKYKEPAS